MNYSEMREWLTAAFEENGFEDQLQARRWNSRGITALSVQNQSGEIRITFPGYKSRKTDDGIVFDYRVNAAGREDIAISHVNILADIFEKVRNFPEIGPEFIRFLLDLAQHGCDVRAESYPALLALPAAPIDRRLAAQLNRVHLKLGKSYNAPGNGWSYTIAELADYIPWIVLQEDINYPMPQYLGRRMPFFRYLEAVYCGMHFTKTVHRISDVAIRALSHSRVALWTDVSDDLKIPYRQIEQLSPDRQPS